MSNRLMTDRDHLEALITAAEHLLRNINQAGEVETTRLQIRLATAADRARRDVYPQG